MTLTHEFVKEQFKKVGYTLLSEYKYAIEKLEFICDNGHNHFISWNSFKKGTRCSFCFGNKKLTHEIVKKEFEKENYKMLSLYKNVDEKVNLICPNNHKCSICFDKFKIGRRCGLCKPFKKQLTHEFVEKEFSEIGYKLLEKYLKSDTKMLFLCDKGHKYYIKYNDIQQNGRCGLCFQETLQGCYDLRHLKIYNRIKNKSKIDNEKLLKMTKNIHDKIYKFYNNTPPGNVVDHVLPFSWFNHDNEKEIYACWSLENLQHLTFTDNVKKSNSLTFKEYRQLTKKQLNILKLASDKPSYINDYRLKALKTRGVHT